MDFGRALKALKDGKKVSRSGWNGKGMWLAIVAGDQWGMDSKVHDYVADGYDLADFIGMKTADNRFVPWLASQTDILAHDWGIL